MKKLGILWKLMALASQSNYIGLENIIEIGIADFWRILCFEFKLEIWQHTDVGAG